MTDPRHSDDQLRRLWRSLDPPAPTPVKEIFMQAKHRSEKLNRTLFWRDLREGLAILLVIGIDAYVALAAPGWTPWLGVAALCVAGAVVWRGLRRGRDQDPDPTAPTTAWLEAELRRLDIEIEKLRTVGSWYVLPLAIGGTVAAVSFVPALGLPAARALGAAVFVVAFCAGLFLAVGKGVQVLNLHAVKRQLLPFRSELEGLMAETPASPSS